MIVGQRRNSQEYVCYATALVVVRDRESHLGTTVTAWRAERVTHDTLIRTDSHEQAQ